jgi:hypothetical protein
MSLFSSIAGIFGGKRKKKAVAAAAQLQANAATDAMDYTKGQFAQTSGNLQPYADRGNAAGNAIFQLLGLGDPGSQQTALDGLHDSPLFKMLYHTGEESILQNASATGGLRGGDTQHSLATFGADTFAKVLQQQIANLGGLSGEGLQGASTLGGLSNQNSSLMSKLFEDRGQAQAGKVLGKAAADQDILGNILGTITSAVSMFMPGGGAAGAAGAAGGFNNFGTSIPF